MERDTYGSSAAAAEEVLVVAALRYTRSVSRSHAYQRVFGSRRLASCPILERRTCTYGSSVMVGNVGPNCLNLLFAFVLQLSMVFWAVRSMVRLRINEISFGERGMATTRTSKSSWQVLGYVAYFHFKVHLAKPPQSISTPLN